MKTRINYLLCLLCIILIVPITVQAYVNNPSSKAADEEIPKLQNPMSVQYLKKNLQKSQPRLVLNSNIEQNLKKKLKTDPVVQNMYKAIQLNAAEIQKQPLLERVRTVHHRISHYIHSGRGRRLQNIDSRITEGILMRMTEMNVPVLPVHDSYIVPEKHENLLEEVMTEAYERELGYRPVISK